MHLFFGSNVEKRCIFIYCNEITYDVSTYWGRFRLDEGAYNDYLAGKLWITWVPAHAREHVITEEPVLHREIPTQVTKKAAALRDAAARNGLFETLSEYFPNTKIPLPYRKRLGDLSIDEMNLSVRSMNGLKRASAHTLGRVMEIMEREAGLRSVRNLGAKSEREIHQGFFSFCYNSLTQNEKAIYWQRVIDETQNSQLL